MLGCTSRHWVDGAFSEVSYLIILKSLSANVPIRSLEEGYHYVEVATNYFRRLSLRIYSRSIGDLGGAKGDCHTCSPASSPEHNLNQTAWKHGGISDLTRTGYIRNGI
jgi:hypothetical protein